MLPHSPDLAEGIAVTRPASPNRRPRISPGRTAEEQHLACAREWSTRCNRSDRGVIESCVAAHRSCRPADVPSLDAIRDVSGWSFVLVDSVVTQLKIDYRFTLILENGVEIVIAEPFVLRETRGSEVTVPPGDKVYEVQAALPLFNQHVRQIRALESGVLQIVFDSGAEIEVPTNVSFETWQIVFPDGRMWIGSPGGGVTLHPEGHT